MHNFITLIQRGGGTGPVKPRQPVPVLTLATREAGWDRVPTPARDQGGAGQMRRKASLHGT